MFCKWCGNTIRPEEKCCPVCGRETPPMSDCGGFYNLKFPKCEVNLKSASSQAAPNFPIVEKMEHKYAADQKKAKRHYKTAVVAVGMLFLLTAICTVGFCSLHIQLGNMEDQIQNRWNEIAITEPTETEEQANDIRIPHWFQLNMTAGENVEIGANQDLVEYLGEGSFRISQTAGDQEQIFAVCYTAKQEYGYVNLKVTKGLNAEGNWKVSAVCDTDISLFADTACEYRWEYREKAGTWMDVNADMVFSEEQGAQYVEWDMLEELEHSAEAIELRCRIHMENADGDEMTLTADGIFITLGEEMTVS